MNISKTCEYPNASSLTSLPSNSIITPEIVTKVFSRVVQEIQDKVKPKKIHKMFQILFHYFPDFAFNASGSIFELPPLLINILSQNHHELITFAFVLKFAAMEQDLNLLKRLVKSPEIKNNFEALNSALGIAADKGSYAMVECLVNHGADPNDNKFGSIICRAVNSGNLSVVKFLVERGAKVIDYGSQSLPPIYYALTMGSFVITKFFIDNGVDVKKLEFLPLVPAAEGQNLELFKYLVEEHQLNIDNYSDAEKKSLLHSAACSGNVDFMRYLETKFQLGIGIFSQEELGGLEPYNFHTAAISSGSIPLYEYLAEKGLPLSLGKSLVMLSRYDRKHPSFKSFTVQPYAYVLRSVVGKDDKELLLKIARDGLHSLEGKTLKELSEGKIKQWNYKPSDKGKIFRAARRSQIILEHIKKPLEIALKRRLPPEIVNLVFARIDLKLFHPEKRKIGDSTTTPPQKKFLKGIFVKPRFQQLNKKL